MKLKKLFLILVLLCAIVQGAWAQDSWEEVYAMTNTTSADWTQLNAGSTTGQTIGAAGTTRYYYADTNLSFTNSMAGGSGLTILGTVYLFVPYGVTVTCTGADASGRTGAGAGIELPWGNALYLIGQGSVSATGGNAAGGSNGTNGTDANWDSSNYWSGTGGNGGDGGGGAGAGIGTRGGQGGSGGAGAASTVSAWSNAGGKWGNPGQAGATYPMGELCVSTSIESLTATGGAAATTSGSAGSAGKGYLYDGTYNYSAAGGGGGGGGGFGGAASNIGTGGPGGGGGGGGASSNLDWASSGYYVVKAPGGSGGQNANGTWAAAGGESIMNHDGLKNGQVITNGSGWADDAYNYDRYVSHQNLVAGGSGGSCGPASTSGSAIRLNPSIKHPTQEEWDVLCSQTLTIQSQWTELPFGTPAGTTLGTAGTTTYYYTTGDRLFANTVGSGLTILGTVYIYIQSGQTITCKGAHASGATGAGAGIELAEGNTLHLLGSGTLNATGGNAANGGNGANGDDVNFVYNQYCQPGSGGNGGDGGGGAGAGIGTPGGNGGSGGTGGIAKRESNQGTNHGVAGNVGGDGSTAGPMGTLYAASDITLNVKGGDTATSGGAGGNRGKNAAQNPYEQYTASGGGGGGGGGFGGAASNIGTGGPGGGAGGGGAAGNSEYYPWAYGGFYRAGAGGGTGGRNANGSSAANGTTSELRGNNIYAAEFIGGLDHDADEDGWHPYDYEWSSGNEMLPGGSGGAPGSASISSTVNRTVNWPTAGAGTAESPYTISSAEEWNTFASRVNNGTKYSDQHMKLTANISVSAMAGSSETRSFQGTFDGDSHTLTINVSNQPRFAAPFKYVDGATIQNLRVAGSINGSVHADGKLLSGLVGHSNGNTTITNCVSSATLTTDFGADAELAGIVAATGGGSLTISGCVFNGSMTGAANTGCAGIAGAEFAATTTTITNALFAPATLTVSTADDGKTKTISRDADAVITDCYFTKALGTDQGAQAATPSTAFTGLGSPITDYGMVKAYAKGILFDGTYYGTYAAISLADNADNRTAISDANGYVADVTLTGRTLYRDGDWNTLCLPFSLDNIYGTCLQGATVKTLESTGFSDGTLTMNFTENVNGIEAGKPYIVKWEPVDLSTLTTHYTAQDGETLTGTLGASVKISIAAGATVKLQDVTINGTNYRYDSWAGISCLGNATIILKGTNTVKGFYAAYPGIYVPSGSTLTIKGSGSLTARGCGDAAGIGGGREIPCGNIVIEGGTINAYGGYGAPGIGGGRRAPCGDITITDGVTKVYAERGAFVGAIGRGDGNGSSCGTVTIGGEVVNITASTYTYTGTGSGSVDVAVPNLVNPEFKSVIVSDAPANVSTNYVDFVGTYSPVSIYTDKKTNLYLGAENTLYYPTDEGFKVNAFRGYFQLKQGLTVGEAANGVRAFVLNFGDDSNATGIVSAEANSSLFTLHSSLSEWYSLDGRRLNGKPTAKGIYINNGRKVVIK